MVETLVEGKPRLQASGEPRVARVVSAYEIVPEGPADLAAFPCGWHSIDNLGIPVVCLSGNMQNEPIQPNDHARQKRKTQSG